MAENTEIFNGPLPVVEVATEALTDGSRLQSVELHTEAEGVKRKVDAANPLPVAITGAVTVEALLQAILTKIAVHVDNETPAGARNGANRDYSVVYPYKPGTTKLYLNGVRLAEGPSADYVELGGQAIRLTLAPLAADALVIDYVRS